MDLDFGQVSTRLILKKIRTPSKNVDIVAYYIFEQAMLERSELYKEAMQLKGSPIAAWKKSSKLIDNPQLDQTTSSSQSRHWLPDKETCRIKAL